MKRAVNGERIYNLWSSYSVELTSKWISDYVWREKVKERYTRHRNCQFNLHSAPPPPPLAGHKTQCNRIPKLFQWLLPLSHRHLSALIHDKLSHLIHDKSSERPIETRRWRQGGWEGGAEDGGLREEARRKECAARHLNDQAVIA